MFLLLVFLLSIVLLFEGALMLLPVVFSDVELVVTEVLVVLLV